MESKILEGLNPAQREAVVNYDVPSLIIAGAGSGKTRVLTSRIAYMIEQGIAPWSILALTFTNKAAQQMRERIGQMVPQERSRHIRMGTFHSIFSRILRENAERIGFPDSFTIYEPTDCKNLIKTIVKELSLADDKYKPNVIASRISYAKNCLVTPGAYAANTTFSTEDRQAQIPEFGNIYNIYCQRCKRNGSMDFDDLLLQTNILLRDCPDVLARYQEQFTHILVDEYQDTNFAQYVIIRRLSQHHSRVCVVGDDAQSIYSFRGAKIENILTFRKDFPEAMTFKLEQNYRSTRTIVEAANSVIVRNSKRMDKNCFSEGPMGDKIRVLKAYTDRDEAEQVTTDIRDRIRASGDMWSEVVVLYRTNNQSLVIEDNLRRRGIPYRIYKGNSFYDHKEVRDLLAYIRLVVNPRDDEAFKRIVNYPTRGIGDTTVERITQLAQQNSVSMWEAVDRLVAEPVQDPIQRTIARKVAEFVEMIRTLSLARTEKGVYDFGLEIATRSGIIGAYRLENTPEATSALNNIEELLNSMQLFKEQRDAEIRGGERTEDEQASIEEWVQNVMLATDMDKEDPEDRNKVTLMTVHSAKGLEYKYVYIVGLEENLFPSQRAMESADGFEEERRLFYVALTRAKEVATISFAEMRFKWGNMEFSRPSCFLREIDPKYLDADFDVSERPAQPSAEKGTAIDELRRQFDYRHKKPGDASEDGRPHFSRERKPFGNHPQGGSRVGGGSSGGSRVGGGSSFGGSSFGGSSGGSRVGGGSSGGSRPVAPEPVAMPRPSTDSMRRLGVRMPGTEGAAGACTSYVIGERVEHPKFGVGSILRIETLAMDHKLVVDFGNYGEKTLLAKFAKLTKL